ncbi:MAG: hypothetical protein ACLFVO_26110 [Chloroflexaceae bacterium]
MNPFPTITTRRLILRQFTLKMPCSMVFCATSLMQVDVDTAISRKDGRGAKDGSVRPYDGIIR